MTVGETIRDILVTCWLLLVAVVFFGPYLAVLLPVNVSHALYAVFLLTVIVTVLLRFLRRDAAPNTGKS